MIIQRLRFILENETLSHSLNAKSSTRSRTLSQDDSLDASLFSTSMVELSIELEWARRTERSNKPEKATLSQALADITKCTSILLTLEATSHSQCCRYCLKSLLIWVM